MSAVLVEVKLEIETCYQCGIPFGMPDYHKKKLLTDGGTFYCPNGHPQVYCKPKVPELEKKLKEALKSKELYQQWYRAEQDDHEHTRRRLSATQGVVTKTKKRIANGVCPCCSRHFVNLQRHMETKHPNFSAETEAAG